MAQFKQDRMTEKERFQALLNRQPVDRVPFFMWALSFAAVNSGYPKIVTYADPEKSFEMLRCTHEMFDGWHWTYYTAGALGVREFNLPYQKEIHERILELGVKHIHVHVCGEQNLNLSYWTEVPFGDPGILRFGHEVDLDRASEYFPNDIIVGNVEPAVIHTGKPEKIYELSRICIEKGKKHPGGYALSPGCELPPLSPPYNVWTMRKAINDFGWYE